MHLVQSHRRFHAHPVRNPIITTPQAPPPRFPVCTDPFHTPSIAYKTSASNSFNLDP